MQKDLQLQPAESFSLKQPLLAHESLGTSTEAAHAILELCSSKQVEHPW